MGEGKWPAVKTGRGYLQNILQISYSFHIFQLVVWLSQKYSTNLLFMSHFPASDYAQNILQHFLLIS